MKKLLLIVATLFLAEFVDAQPYANMLTKGRNGREMFFSDTLNAYFLYRTYPVPKVRLTPPPKGYEAVYVSMYARHGSRKLHREDYSAIPRRVLASADSAGKLTPLGRDVLRKVSAVDDDAFMTQGELTSVGVEQHRGIAERMFRNYTRVFTSEDAVIKCYSTVTQRTMMSMFANNERLKELYPDMKIDRRASNADTCLNNHYHDPYRHDPHAPCDDFLQSHFDTSPVLDKLFEPGAPLVSDTVDFIRCLYLTGAIVPGLDIRGVDYLRQIFSLEELYVLQQGMNYMMYVRIANSPLNGRYTLQSQKPLLKDIVDKADAALASGLFGADLRFGHDSYLVPLVALMGINGYDACIEDPDKITDVFQDYAVSPMAGNIQFVFYRNKKGNVIVKVLHNEIESAIPLKTDMFPYYSWKEVKDYFTGLL